MTGTAKFSDCGTYRYSLTRNWKGVIGTDPDNICTFVMLNPSTADADRSDNTITRCINFAQSWGYDGLHVVNLFALRSTSPEALYHSDDPIGPGNDEAILAAPRRLVVCAWGTDGGLRNRAAAVLEMLDREGVETRCLGFTKSGQPKHPLYLPKHTQPAYKIIFTGESNT